MIAFFNKISDYLITFKSLLNLYISYNKTVLKEGINPYLSDLNISFFPEAFSNKPGKPFFSSLVLSNTISSGV